MGRFGVINQSLFVGGGECELSDRSFGAKSPFISLSPLPQQKTLLRVVPGKQK
jgi:hypothetical protein